MCPSTTFWDPSSDNCLPCAANCTSCIGPAINQCLSCGPGATLKSGMCEAASCAVDGFEDNLSLCFSNIVNDGIMASQVTWWPYLLIVLFLLAAAGGGGCWYIRRERRRTRNGTIAFGNGLEEAEVGRKVRGLQLSRLQNGQPASPSAESGGPPTPPSSRAGFFTFLSARSPPTSPLSPGRSWLPGHSPRHGKLRPFQLDRQNDRESFCSFPMAPPPAYSPTDDMFSDDKIKQLRTEIAALGTASSPGPSAGPQRQPSIRWSDIATPGPIVPGPERLDRPTVWRSQSNDTHLQTAEMLDTYTHERPNDSLGRRLQRSLSNSIQGMKRDGRDDGDASWLFEQPNASRRQALQARDELAERPRGDELGLMEMLRDSRV